METLTDEKAAKFKNWLASQGAEIQPVTNEYEVLRFRCRLGTGVLYQSSKGRFSVNTAFVLEAYQCFKDGKKWAGKGKPGKRINGSRSKRALVDRDGRECFFCGNEMENNEMTEEHLLSIVHGGSNRLENKVLCCKSCNELAGHLPVIEKVKLREKMRSEKNA